MKVRMNRKAGRLIAWLMAVVMLLGTVGYCPVGSNVAEAADGKWPVWHGLTATSFAGGSGTKNDPYQIRWGSQLRLLAEKVNSGVSYTGTYFILTHDIILNDETNVAAYIENRNKWYKAASEPAKAALESELSQYIENNKVNVWESIGYYASAESNRVFSGNFDGKGHTIKGLLSCTNSTNGLFGYVGSGAVIDNVKIDDSYIEGSGNGVGGVVGLNSGSVTNCTNNGNVVSVWLDGGRRKAGSSGGVVGVNNDTVANCSNTGNVYGVGSTGGVVGTNYKSVVNCSNEGKIGSNEEGYALVNGNMSAVKDYASIYGTGGIVGLNREVNSSIENSYNLGSVYASDNAGGIAGIAQGVIVNCYNNETVEADGNDSYAGAIACTLAYTGDTKKGNIVYSYWKQGVAGDKLVAYTGNAVLDDTKYCPYNADTRALIPNGGAANIPVGDPGVDVANLLDALRAWVAYKNDDKYSDWREGKNGLPVFGEAADDSWQGLGDSEKPVGAGTENNPYLISSGKNLNWVRANNLQLGTDSYLALTNDIKLNDETFEFVPDTGLVKVNNANNSVMYYGTGIKGDASDANNTFDTTPSIAGQWYDGNYDKITPNEYTGIHEWTPIGNEENPFAGHFDGRGYSISGVFVSSGNVSCWGLFGKINGEVSNLTISDSFIFSKEGDYAGGITGVLSGTVENCCTEKTIVMSSGQINNTTNEYTYTGCLGGITGKNEPGSTVDGCHIGTGALIIGTAEAVGGISGYNYGGKIINSYNDTGNNSTVIGKRDAESYVGGIAGVNASEGKGLNGTPENPKPDIYGYIENCYDRGTVTGNDKAYVGGIAGYNLGGKINNVYADTTVSGGFTMNGVQCSGEIVGFNGDSIGKSDTVMGQTVVYYKPEKGIIADAYCAAGKNICGMPKDDSSKQEVDGGNVNTFKYSAASYTLNGADLFTRLNSWITPETETTYAPWKKASDADSHPVFGEKKAAPDEKIEKEPYPTYKITYMLNYEKNNAIFDGDQSYKDEDENDVYYHEISEYQLNPENDDTIAAGNDKLLQLGSDVRKGYILTSWNTKRDGSGDSFELGKATATEDFEAYFEANKCDITLYAQWKSTKAVIISATADDGDAVTISWDPVDKADGYWVYRWSDKEFPNTPFVDIETTSNKIHEADKNEYSVKDYEPYKNADLGAGTYRYGVMAYTKEGDSTIMFNPFSDYAEVVIENRSIVYNGNGSDGGNAVPNTVGIQYTEAEVADNNNSYTRTGYGFTGWNTESDGSGTAYNAGDKVKLDDDVQLYALWRPSPVEGLVGNYNAVDNKIVLSWTSHEWPASYRNNSNITLGYNVYRSEDGVDYTPYKTVSHKYEDATVGCEEQLEVKPDESKSYWYKVVAYKTEKKGVSTFTEESTPETIEVPVTVNSRLELDTAKGRQDPDDNTKCTGIDGTTVYMKWEAAKGATGYELYRSTDKNTYGILQQTIDTGDITCSDEVPDAGTYYYYVRPYTENKDTNGYPVSKDYNSFSKVLIVTISKVKITYNINITGKDITKADESIKDCDYTVLSPSDDLLKREFKNDGYTLEKWNTMKDQTGTAYEFGDKTAFSDDTELYAVWKLDTPDGLAITRDGAKITLTWNKNAAAKGYQISQKTDNGQYDEPVKVAADNSDPAAKTQSREVDIDVDKTYQFKIQAYSEEQLGNGSIVTRYSDEAEWDLSEPNVIEGQVTGLTCAVDPDGTDPADVKLTWDKPAGAVTGYYIYRSAGVFDEAAEVPVNDGNPITAGDVKEVNGRLSWTDTSIEPDQPGDYYYRVRAYIINKDNENETVYYKTYSEPAQATLEQVVIKYISDGDVHEEKTDVWVKGSDAVISAPLGTYTDYEFKEWNTVSDGTGTAHAPFDDNNKANVISDVNDDITLYAVWKINPPTDLVSTVKEEQLILSWTQNASAESYQIFVKKGEEEWSEDPVDTVKASATEPTLTYNAGKVNYTYQYRIKAVDIYEPAPGSGILVSKYSDYAYFPIVAAADAGQVTGLKCSIDKNDASNVDVVWNAPEDKVTGYYIYRTTNEGAPTKDDYIDTVTQNGTEAKPYIDESVDAPGTYYYYVRAYLEDNDGQGDDGIYYKTFSEPAKIVLEPVTITYKYNKNTSKQVTIIKRSGDVKAAECDDTPDGYTFDKWTGTINDEEVEYEIGQAIPSDKLNKDITLTARWKLNAPENVSPILQDDKSSVEITWDNLNGASGYIVYRSTSGEAGPFTELATVTGTVYTDNNDGKVIGKEDNYYYYVKGFEQVEADTRRLGEASLPEPIVIPGIKDDQVVGVACEVNPDGDGKHVRITWDPVDGATGYYVYRSTREDSHGSRINGGEPVKATSLIDKTIVYNEPGEYYYFVRAYHQDDDTLDEAVISYKPFSDYGKAVLEPVTITYKNGKDTYPVTVIKESDGVTAREALPDTANYVFLDWNGTINDEPVYVKPGDAISSDKLKKDVTLNSEWMLKAVTLNAVKSDDGKSIVVSWPNNKNATGYDIFWKIDGSNYPEIANDSTKSSSSNVTYTIRDIDRYSKYWIRVVPYEDILQQSGQGMLKMKGESSEIDVKADEDFIPDGMVTNFAAVKEYDADNNVPYIRFTWTPLNDASGYYIYKSTDPNKDGDIIVDINNDDTPEFFEDSFYEDRSQFDVGSYYYKIRAYKKTASALYYQPFSEQQTVTFEPLTITYMANNTTNVSKEEVKIKGLKVMTADCDFIYDGKKFMSWNTEPDGKGYEYQAGEYTDIAEDTTLYAMWKLDAPINVEAALQDDNSTVDITWNALDGADGYLVYRRIGDAGDYVEIGTVKEPKYSDVNEGSEPGKNAPYYYKVKAYEQIEADIRRLSEYSEAAVIKQDGADAKEGQVTNLKAKVNKATEVSLTWNKVDGAAGYYVYRTDSDQFGGETYFADVTPAKSGDAPAAAYTDSSITSDMPDTFYYYVRAYTKDDNGVYYKPISDPCKVVLEAVTITYNANGGTGNNKVDTVVKGSSNISVRTVDECNIKRAGYSFEGWYGTIGGKDKLYAAGEVFAADDLADNIVLNAKWTLEAVANFTATKDAENDSIVKLNWTANSQATGYYIYRRNGENGTPENYMTVKKGEKLPISFTLSDDEKKNTYYYAVKPFVELEDPITGIITVAVGNETDYLEPGGLALSGQVKDFKAEASNGVVNLSWAAVKDASGYYIYKSTTDNKYGDPYVTIKSGDTEEYTDPGDDEGFKLGTTYYYKIRAYVEKADDTGIEYKPLSDKAEVRFESYTIIYNANIPNIADKDKTKNIDYIKGVNATTLAKSELPISWIYPGRTLVGWNTKEDGTGSLYYAGTEYEVITADNNTVYAVWRLEAPTGVTAELQDDNSTVNITWNPVLGAQGYFIYKKDIKTGAREELGMSKDTSYIDKNEHELGEDEGYYYEVRAYEEVGDSDNRIKRMSDYSEDTPEASVGDTEPVPDTSLGSVTNLTLIGFEGNNAKIGWSGIPKADGYFVYRSIGADGKKEYTGIDVTGNNAYTGELTVNTPYYYYVVAYIMDTINDSRILGNYSEGISVMVTASPAPTSTPSPTPSPTPNPLGKVSNLTVVSTTAGTAELNWDALYNVDGYKIYYSYDEQMEDKVQNVDVTGTTHIIEELPVGSTVYFKVRGYELKIGDGLMYSDYSDTVSVEIFGATPSPAPTAIPTDTPVPTAEPTATPVVSGTPSSAEPTGNPGDATAAPSTEPGQSTQEPTSEPGTSTTAPTTEPGTPTETPTAEPVTPTETPTAEPGTPTEAPTTEPTAAPATEAPTIAPVPDDPRLVHRFFVKDAYNQYINLIWDKAPAAIGYEISYATTLDGVKTVIATPDKDADSMQALPVTGAAFTVNENINASEIQAYNQRANATYYYFIRSKLENNEYGNYSSAIMIALHSNNYVTPQPNVYVTPGPVTQTTPTPVPIQAPDDKKMVSVGDKITKSKLVYKITANTEVSHTVKVMKPVKKTYKSITIPATVTIEGVKFKVTAINKNAFSKNKKLQKLYIGKNVKTIGSKAFYNCSKLKNLVFKGKKVTKIGTYAFKGINKDCQIVIPKAVLKKYKKLIKGSTKKS